MSDEQANNIPSDEVPGQEDMRDPNEQMQQESTYKEAYKMFFERELNSLLARAHQVGDDCAALKSLMQHHGQEARVSRGVQESPSRIEPTPLASSSMASSAGPTTDEKKKQKEKPMFEDSATLPEQLLVVSQIIASMEALPKPDDKN